MLLMFSPLHPAGIHVNTEFKHAHDCALPKNKYTQELGVLQKRY